MKMEIALKLGIDDLLQLCRTNLEFSAICQSEAFWFNRIALDFPDYIPEDNTRVSYRDYYMSLARPRFIPVYHQGDWVQPALPFSDYNLLFSRPELQRLLALSPLPDIAIFYDRNLHPVAYLDGQGRATILHDVLPEVIGVVIADADIPLTQDSVYSQRLSPESPFPYYGHSSSQGLVLFSTRPDPGRGMIVRQVFCRDNPFFAILILSAFNRLVASGRLRMESLTVPVTKTVPTAEIERRLQMALGIPREELEPWISLPTNVICRTVRNALQRIGHMLI